MILGALVDVGVPLARLRRALATLPLQGWTLRSRRVDRCGISARRVEVGVRRGADVPARRFSDVRRIVDGGELPAPVRDRALAIFRRLFEAEARVHGGDWRRVHLHEAGAIDAIVDVVGAAFAVGELGVTRVVVSPLTTGFGRVRCSHGIYPVPAPATLELVRDHPVASGEIETERLTPTGAAVLTTLADAWGPLPAMRPLAVGYGAGRRQLEREPNALRAVLGESAADGSPFSPLDEEVAVIELAVDDATPQALAHAAERLAERGAIDVRTTPTVMKKGRSGHALTVLARPADVAALADLLFAETTTLGLRVRHERRIVLERSTVRVATRHGSVRVKVGRREGRAVQAWPEYDDCAMLARRRGVALADVQQAALESYRRKRRD
jgi:uncharacterized protein (TIGR00299 family) protein